MNKEVVVHVESDEEEEDEEDVRKKLEGLGNVLEEEEEEGMEEEEAWEEGGGGEEEEEGGEGTDSNSTNAVYARVKYAYAAEKEGDLALSVGSIVTMSSDQNLTGDWFYGAINGGTPGYFPASYVRLVSESEAFGEAVTAAEKASKEDARESDLTTSSSSAKPASAGWRLERDTLKARLQEGEKTEARLRAEVAALEEAKGALLYEVAHLKYGTGKGGVMYDLGKLYLGTYFETDSMGETVVATNELVKLLKELQLAIDKGFEKEKDIAAEKNSAATRLMGVLTAAQTELQSISSLSLNKDNFSNVLKTFREKLIALQ